MSLNLSRLISLHIGILVMLFGADYARSEVFTAVVDLESLVETEGVLIHNFQRYIQKQELQLDYLKIKLKEYQKEHNEAAANITEYLSNPINAFLLTKRLTSGWTKIENLVKDDMRSAFLSNVSNLRNTLIFPSTEDLNGAAVALMRLQDTYKLNTSSIAKGELNGIQYRAEMTSDDCFELGFQAFNNNDYYHNVLWMNETLVRLQSERNITPFDISSADILHYLAFSYYKLGLVHTALRKTDELLEIRPDNEEAIGMKKIIEKELDELVKKDEHRNANESLPDLPSNNKSITYYYEKMCRGELKPSLEQLRPLRCRYVSHKNDFLKLAPFKVEEACLSPYIVIYYDVMYDHEIEFLKKVSRRRLERATVVTIKDGSIPTSYRISKTGFIEDSAHPYIGTIVQRAADITNLDMRAAEYLQISNYGIGGHYGPHFDYQREKDGDSYGYGLGNRIATLLFYMSDVEQGGATVFPLINVSVKPKKGSAVFWYNLYASGEGDIRTAHAACPVIKGNKWVSNKWIHEYGQEFRKPCKLFPDHPKPK